MARRIPPLTEMACRRKSYGPAGSNKLFDGGGLYLELRPSGAKLWRMKYRFAGKERLLSIGSYPEVSSEQARASRAEAKTLLAKGIDPGTHRRIQKSTRELAVATTLRTVAEEWIERFSPGWHGNHTRTIEVRLKNDVYPWIGERPIGDISAPELLTVLRRVEKRGALETAHRIRQYFGLIFRYAISTGRVMRDPAADLKGALRSPIVRHYPTITDPVEIGRLLHAVDGYRGHFVTRVALQLAPMLFVRPGELRGAEWDEVDLDAGEWRIPAVRMKMKLAQKLDGRRADHVVPLATQAVAILRELEPLTGGGIYVFPSARTRVRPISDNTVNAALRRLGYGTDDIVGHGFRHMASTLLNEQGWSPDAIERQLAHKEKGIRAVYNRAEYLPERRKMMQAWADYLEALKTTASKPG